jgi:outer membrane protein
MKKIKYLIISLIAFSPIWSSAYEYRDDEGKWIGRIKVGAAIMDSSDSETIDGTPIVRPGSENFFTSSASGEIELDYSFYDHFSLGASLGYQPQETQIWTLGSESDTGKVSVIPASIIAKFHIAPYGQIRPYIGAGYYYAFMKSSYDKIKYENTSGPVFSGGLDWWFNMDWALNLEAKQYLMTTDIDTSSLSGSNNDIVESQIDPLVLSFGITHRF